MSGKKKLHRGLVLVALAAGVVPACSKSSTSSGAAPAGSGKGARGGKGAGGGVEFPVEVAPVDFRQVGYVITAPGSINAFEQVQVTARVAGAVDKVSFTEGANVTQGQVLVSIESERYQVAVDQAKAALAKTQAAESNAESQLARRTGATADHPGLITGEEIATYQTAVQTAKADVAAAGEQVKVAQLNLRDSYVRAPITGVIQTRTVETGQYLQAGNVLATLLQRDPLLLKFQVTEQDAPRVKVGMTATLTMRETTNSYQGTISLVAASADPASHLVPVTATVNDKEHKYWLRPGAFCDVSVPIGGTRPAAVVPESAVRPSENGFLAYVVQGTTAKQRILQLGMHAPGGLVEVTQGLNVGDLLVVIGQQALSDGASVKITDRTTLETFDAGAAPTSTAPIANASSMPASQSSTTAANIAPGSSADPATAGSGGHHHQAPSGQ